MKNLLYRPSWQKLRVSCIKEYNNFGGFTTLVGAKDNIGRLYNYIDDAEPGKVADYTLEENTRMDITEEEEYASRIYRVNNMLTATHMGLRGQGLGGSPIDKLVVKYRDPLKERYNSNKAQSADEKWKWDVIEYELETLWREERYWFAAAYSDLSRRLKVATRRRIQETGGVDDVRQTRSELDRMIKMMEKINDRR